MKALATIATIAALAFALPASAQTDIADFNSIKVYGKMEVSIKFGQEKSVTVKTDEQYKKDISVEVVDGQLRIGAGSVIPRQTNVVVVVGCPKLDAVELGGGAKCFNSGAITTPVLKLEAGAGTELDLLVESDSVDVMVARGGFARLNGKARAVRLKTSSGGSYAADEMENSVFYAEMGGGIARTKTSDKIVANLAAKASLLYTGSPKIVQKEGSKGE
ncbi:MAG: DUF2807 domain-containing protein, partial [Salinivirgaceae bacterium]|nr:DUF2807 domain-containing protein [Salinivirgaceae bacterium]